MNSSAEGRGSLAYGFGANATNENTIAIGGFAFANGTNSYAIGAGAVANGVQAIAIGAGARAEGFNTDPTATGTNSVAVGTSVSAYGVKPTRDQQHRSGFYSNADGVNAIAVGTPVLLAPTSWRLVLALSPLMVQRRSRLTPTRANHMVFGTANTEVTVPNLAGEGTAIVEANSDGTLKRSSISTNDIIINFNRVDGDISNIQGDISNIQGDISGLQNDLRSSSRGLGQAVETAGAMGAAFWHTGVVLLPDEPVRCGFATGGWGSRHAVAGGCAARVADRLHVNGAIAYAPSVVTPWAPLHQLVAALASPSPSAS